MMEADESIEALVSRLTRERDEARKARDLAMEAANRSLEEKRQAERTVDILRNYMKPRRVTEIMTPQLKPGASAPGTL